MNHLFVFIDFTEATELALAQALAIVNKDRGHITLCHIAKHGDAKTLKQAELHMHSFKERVESAGIHPEILIDHGDLFERAKSLVAGARPSLVVAGTHGSDGINLSIFGSAIRKLVREVKVPSLVIGEKCKVVTSGFSSILLPGAPHKSYLQEVALSCDLLAEDGQITLFIIRQDDEALDDLTDANIEAAKKLMDKRQVKWILKELQAKPHSVGFSEQTLEYLRQEQIQLVAISAEVSDRAQHFGKLDKEALLLNEDGVMILCVNDAQGSGT